MQREREKVIGRETAEASTKGQYQSNDGRKGIARQSPDEWLMSGKQMLVKSRWSVERPFSAVDQEEEAMWTKPYCTCQCSIQKRRGFQFCPIKRWHEETPAARQEVRFVHSTTSRLRCEVWSTNWRTNGYVKKKTKFVELERDESKSRSGKNEWRFEEKENRGRLWKKWMQHNCGSPRKRCAKYQGLKVYWQCKFHEWCCCFHGKQRWGKKSSSGEWCNRQTNELDWW